MERTAIGFVMMTEQKLIDVSTRGTIRETMNFA